MMSEGAAAIEHADSQAVLRARLQQFDWYHTQELAPGVVTPGIFDLRPYVQHYGLPDDMSGMRALDVGTFEGFWAFEMERRGAEVVAIDVDSIQRLDWPPQLRPSGDGRRGEGFALVRDALGMGAQRLGLSAYELTPEAVGGTFDLVFCGSVLIHLRDPMLALERMASVCAGKLVVTEEYSRRLAVIPKLRLAEFTANSPWMTWWRPSLRTWLDMVECAGFERPRVQSRFSMRFRERPGAVRHAVIHAEGMAQR
jgi:tRNA (mo5U34)-methyltransferase